MEPMDTVGLIYTQAERDEGASLVCGDGPAKEYSDIEEDVDNTRLKDNHRHRIAPATALTELVLGRNSTTRRATDKQMAPQDSPGHPQLGYLQISWENNYPDPFPFVQSFLPVLRCSSSPLLYRFTSTGHGSTTLATAR